MTTPAPRPEPAPNRILSQSESRTPRPPLDAWPVPAWTPRAVVFDCDGLLVDTEAQWIATQDDYLASHGAAMDAATRRELTGRSGEAVVGTIARMVGRDPYEVADALVALHEADADRALTMLPGAERTVRAIAAKVPVAVASNSPRALLDGKLAATGLADVVDASVAIEDVEHPKPAPDMYARAARLLGAEAADALAFEDSETGAQAALSAGLVLIAVPSLPGQEPEAHLRLASLEDPALHVWIDTWETLR
ncbi:HAD family hydrolase [Brachybacterium huguangmaarense]